MPVKLPGLDSQRLPEISYVPVVLNLDAMSKGGSYEFERTFNHAPIRYKVTAATPGSVGIKLAIEVSQDTDGFEDAYGNPAEESAAKSKLSTHLVGTGSAIWNIAKAKFDIVTVETNAETTVTVLKTGKKSTRNLKTTLKIVRDGAKVDE